MGESRSLSAGGEAPACCLPSAWTKRRPIEVLVALALASVGVLHREELTDCLVHRGLQDSPVLDRIVRIKGPDLLEKKDLANKILSFT